MRAGNVTARPRHGTRAAAGAEAGHEKGAQGRDLGSAAGDSRQGWLRGSGGNVTENEGAPPFL